MVRAYKNLSFALVTTGWIAAAAGALVVGCKGDDPDQPPPVVTPTGSCVPIDNKTSVGDTCGVFVAAAGSDAAAGTKSAPVATLAKAISLAQTKGNVVYACAEAFAESVEVPAGVTIYGGLNCADMTWSYVGATTKTMIHPPADAPGLVFKKGAGKTHIEDIDVMAADATLPGGSSVAAVADGGTVDFVRCSLIAGAGAPGAVGSTPPGPVMPSSPDDPLIAGNPGTQACMGGMAGNVGGEAKANPMCGTSVGGAGGTGLETNGEKGADGMVAPDPNPNGFGLGGAGSTGAGCQSGQTGALGEPGGPGIGGTGLGMLDAKGITGAVGVAGLMGGPGQGGGGGGGAKGSLNCYGASGGGGGAGGCGGAGGLGGQAGGSSVALISLGATITFKDVVLTAGAGGKGGDGGDGQLGGVGGTGGKAGVGPPAAACDGGSGGSGGQGGKGGGGVGGHSIGIAATGAAPAVEGATITVGAPGDGGLGEGAPATGAAGVAANTQAF